MSTPKSMATMTMTNITMIEVWMPFITWAKLSWPMRFCPNGNGPRPVQPLPPNQVGMCIVGAPPGIATLYGVLTSWGHQPGIGPTPIALNDRIAVRPNMIMPKTAPRCRTNRWMTMRPWDSPSVSIDSPTPSPRPNASSSSSRLSNASREPEVAASRVSPWPRDSSRSSIRSSRPCCGVRVVVAHASTRIRGSRRAYRKSAMMFATMAAAPVIMM